MNKLLQYLMGYKTLSFKEKYAQEFFNFVHKQRVVNWGYTLAEDVISVNIALSDFDYFLNFFSSLNIEYEQSETKGLPGFFAKYKKRIGVWIGLSLFLIILLLSTLFVWDVRVIGAQTLNENEIIENLDGIGLGVGSFIPFIHTTEIANKYLVNYDNVSFVSINPKGNVVYVEIIEEKNSSQSEKKGKYANVVASEDAVIESLVISRGSAVTAVGKTVKKGDLLISGISSSPRKYAFTYADGNVYGRVSRELEIEIPFSQVQKEYKTPKKKKISIKFFGFTINIFRYCGKMPAKYDTIYKKEQIILFHTVHLPVYINSESYIPYENRVIQISEEQAVELAFNRLKTEFFAVANDADVISKNIEGTFTEDSYVLRCYAECIKDIAVPLEFVMD